VGARLLGAEYLFSCWQVTGAVGWRKDNIRYKKNEVFLDIVEQARPSPLQVRMQHFQV
jgi:hypothetical protein